MDEQRNKLMSSRDVAQGVKSEERNADVLSEEQEAFLSGITTSGQFGLSNVVKMYTGVVRMRSDEVLGGLPPA